MPINNRETAKSLDSIELRPRIRHPFRVHATLLPSPGEWSGGVEKKWLEYGTSLYGTGKHRGEREREKKKLSFHVFSYLSVVHHGTPPHSQQRDPREGSLIGRAYGLFSFARSLNGAANSLRAQTGRQMPINIR